LRLALCLIAGLAGGADISGFGVSGSGSGDVAVVRVGDLDFAFGLVVDLAEDAGVFGSGSGDAVVVRAGVLPFAFGLGAADSVGGAGVSGSGSDGEVGDTSTVTVPFVSGVTTATTI